MDWGHNKSTCRNQPVSSGRRQRARDWLEEEVVIILGDLESGQEEGTISSDSSELSDLPDSDIEEEEIDRINKVIERRVTRFGSRML